MVKQYQSGAAAYTHLLNPNEVPRQGMFTRQHRDSASETAEPSQRGKNASSSSKRSADANARKNAPTGFSILACLLLTPQSGVDINEYDSK